MVDTVWNPCEIFKKNKKNQGIKILGFLNGAALMDLNEIKDQLEEKDKIENNPFSSVPLDRVKRALLMLEEYSEEINFRNDS